MHRAKLSWTEKFAILAECKKRGVTGGCRNIDEVRGWAKSKLQLNTETFYRTIMRILKDQESIQERVKVIGSDAKKKLAVTNSEVDNIVRDWVYEMWERRVFLSDSIFQEQARRVQYTLNTSLSPGQRTFVQFTNGWLHLFLETKQFQMFQFTWREW